MKPDKKLSDATKKADKLGVTTARRHVLLCYDRKAADCASKKAMEEAWTFLKQRLKELGLRQKHGVTRIPALCLDVCKGGPIMIVYPEGVWYGGCNPAVIEEILQRHVLGGDVVSEHVMAAPPLCADKWKR